MRMEQIEQILTIASCGSINKAARELFMSQPNLSMMLQSIENELGKPLFIRSGKGVELTDFGREFLEFSQPIKRQFDLFKEIIAKERNNQLINFSIAVEFLHFASLLFIEIYNLHKDQNIKSYYYEGTLLEVIEKVASLEAEVGIVIIPSLQKDMLLQIIRNKDIEYHSLFESQFSVVVGKNSPLFKYPADHISAKMLENLPLVTFGEVNYNSIIAWDQLNINSTIHPIIVADSAILYEVLTSTDAYSIVLPTLNAYRNTPYYSNLRLFSLSDRGITLELGWIIKKSHSISKISEEFIERITQVCKECQKDSISDNKH